MKTHPNMAERRQPRIPGSPVGTKKVLRHLISEVKTFCENEEATRGSLEPGGHSGDQGLEEQ